MKGCCFEQKELTLKDIGLDGAKVTFLFSHPVDIPEETLVDILEEGYLPFSIKSSKDLSSISNKRAFCNLFVELPSSIPDSEEIIAVEVEDKHKNIEVLKKLNLSLEDRSNTFPNRVLNNDELKDLKAFGDFQVLLPLVKDTYCFEVITAENHSSKIFLERIDSKNKYYRMKLGQLIEISPDNLVNLFKEVKHIYNTYGSTILRNLTAACNFLPNYNLSTGFTINKEMLTYLIDKRSMPISKSLNKSEMFQAIVNYYKENPIFPNPTSWFIDFATSSASNINYHNKDGIEESFVRLLSTINSNDNLKAFGSSLIEPIAERISLEGQYKPYIYSEILSLDTPCNYGRITLRN